MSVRVAPVKELQRQLREETHWFIVFGRDRIDRIDVVDQNLGREDTWPTGMLPTPLGLVAITFIPKSELSFERLEMAIERAGFRVPVSYNGGDIFFLAGDREEVDRLIRAVEWLSQFEFE